MRWTSWQSKDSKADALIHLLKKKKIDKHSEKEKCEEYLIDDWRASVVRNLELISVEITFAEILKDIIAQEKKKQEFSLAKFERKSLKANIFYTRF